MYEVLFVCTDFGFPMDVYRRKYPPHDFAIRLKHLSKLTPITRGRLEALGEENWISFDEIVSTLVTVCDYKGADAEAVLRKLTDAVNRAPKSKTARILDEIRAAIDSAEPRIAEILKQIEDEERERVRREETDRIRQEEREKLLNKLKE